MIPLEPITALVGLALGAYVKVKDKQQEIMRLAIEQKQQVIDDVQHAREQEVKVPETQWTKRVIAIMLVGTFCALHLGISIPELFGLKGSTTIGYTQIEPKFLFFGEKEAVKWVTVAGGAITSAFSNAVMLVMGYYFGVGGTRK